MPTYHINVRTDSHIATSTEVEGADLTALRIVMAQFGGELLKNHAELIWSDEKWRIDLTDEAGLILYVLNITASGNAGTTPLIP